jgi:cephalosporin hydroxylase
MDACEAYQSWYYDSLVWETTTWRGIPCLKSVSDMWNYQEILWELKPALIVEFGTWRGGSALFFAEIAPQARVLSIDIDHSIVLPVVKLYSRITLLEGNSADPETIHQVIETRHRYPGPAFFIVDSDHHKEHVLQELIGLRLATHPGDYLVVEDGIINGHPVLPDFGPGPLEALAEYMRRYPHDYRRDLAREKKFGFTWAPHGFLIRNPD